MIAALRRRLTYANVMATLAVFIALGGSSYAALRVTGRDVANGSLTYRDLKRNTLGGGRIKESKLGTVRRARNADRLDGVTAGRLLVHCARGTVPVSNVCVETKFRSPAPYGSAAVVCEGTDRFSGPGRRLPVWRLRLGASSPATSTHRVRARDVWMRCTSPMPSAALESHLTQQLAPRPSAASPIPGTERRPQRNPATTKPT